MNVGCHARDFRVSGCTDGFLSRYYDVMDSLKFCAPRDIKTIKDSTYNTTHKTPKAETERKEGETYNE